MVFQRSYRLIGILLFTLGFLMQYTSIHIYGHVLADDVLHAIESSNDKTPYQGCSNKNYASNNLLQDIDYAWSSLRNDYHFFNSRIDNSDQYGTKKVRNVMTRLFFNLGYSLDALNEKIKVGEMSFAISHQDSKLNNMPVHIVGDVIKDNLVTSQQDTNSLDYRVKGSSKQTSPHATMQSYLNFTDRTYGIITNCQTLRLIRTSGQLVKLSYIEFDLKKMIEEDKYTEFCLFYRLLHASRFVSHNDETCIFEQWFNESLASGNRIRNGLSEAVQDAMVIFANAALQNEGKGNEYLRNCLDNKLLSIGQFNKELIHLIYRLLFLFVVEDRKLIYNKDNNKELSREESIYYEFYAVSRLRNKSEIGYLHNANHFDLWQGLQDTFKLFCNADFGKPLGIKPLGGVLFDEKTIKHLKSCNISNKQLLDAFSKLNEFEDDKGSIVRINYNALDIEEFGSVYEGILEKSPYLSSKYEFSYIAGSDRKTSASYYTRPDLVQALIKATLEPAIKERLDAHKGDVNAQINALLAMRVCDPACGSGHFILAMARTIAWYVCTLRTGEDNPASYDYRLALREVIAKCVYAVDINPDAVELCKVVLWIESYCSGKPLSFLDHHIRCGNSVLGLGNDLNMLTDGVPDEAFSCKDKELLKALKQANQKVISYLTGSAGRGQSNSLWKNLAYTVDLISTLKSIGKILADIASMADDSVSDVLRKQDKVNELKASKKMQDLYNAANIYTYAYFKEFDESDSYDVKNPINLDIYSTGIIPNKPYSGTVIWALDIIKKVANCPPLHQSLIDDAKKAAQDYKFFHWAIEFPEIYDQGGFDVICGNPPWDKIKIEDKQWFAHEGEADIVNEANSSKRKKLIDALENTNPELYKKYLLAKNSASLHSNFYIKSKRFELTAKGDINLYPLLAEHSMSISRDRWGLIVPTGIATDNNNKDFFQKVVKDNRLCSLYDFENKDKIFDIHRSFKFCLLSAKKSSKELNDISVGFMLTLPEQILDSNRVFTLSSNDFEKFNPNTRTCPIFRTSKDAILTLKIYSNSSILEKEDSGNKEVSDGDNPWDVIFLSEFHMTNDSSLFRTYEQLLNSGAELKGSNFVLGTETYVPLYEAKMMERYNHHFAKFPDNVKSRPNGCDSISVDELQDVNLAAKPWYWISSSVLEQKLNKSGLSKTFKIAFRRLTNTTNSRTMISCLLPKNFSCGHSIGCMFVAATISVSSLLLAMLNSLVLDFSARQKMSGSNMSDFIAKQLPVLRPEQIDERSKWLLIKRVAELTYFNHDMDDFAKELSEELTDEQNAELENRLSNQEPWVFNEERRAILQAEIDAIVAKLYKLDHDELRYILDPEDIFGKDSIHETFRVLKENEIKQFNEFRTKRLVLEAWDKLNQGLLS